MTAVKLDRRRLLQSAAAGAGLLAVTRAEAAQPAWKDQKKTIDILGARMAYVERGTGRPIVFLHGNPTSSYLWRNIIPYVEHLGRCIAPDLIGMGDSAKLPHSGPGTYSYATHKRHLHELLRRLGVERDAILVIHDWGSALGLEFAAAYPNAVRGVAYMEAILFPPTSTLDFTTGGTFAALRSPKGEEMILQNNAFIEQLLIGGLKYYLTPEDEAEYRRPFLQPGESRRATLDWPRELPLRGEPKHTQDIVAAYSRWFAASQMPKLFLHAVPGGILGAGERLDFARTFPNQKEVQVFGGHYVQEVSPQAIGRALAEWITALG
jgi:haloalkane dehalogenase